MENLVSLSGFPEGDLEATIVENFVVSTLQRTFELHGFARLSTRAVEPVKELLAKGETSKEIYLLRRLQEDPVRAAQSKKQLGLHFDLTVPFARYVRENAGRLDFPFKRYQIQKVWRGERPQDGRFREFIQADIDVVGDGTLPFAYEVEVALVMADALAALPIPEATILVNNRKVVQGFCEALGIDDVEGALRSLDKLDKIGPDGVAAEMRELGFAEDAIAKLAQMAQIGGGASEVREGLAVLEVDSPTLREGVDELCALLEETDRRRPGRVRAQLRIARGLDYYTGTVYETEIAGHADLGSICSGGRYDSLVRQGKRTFPGVGLSIGVSRLVSRMLSASMVSVSRKVPTVVLVAVTDEEARPDSIAVAEALRERGIACDVAPEAQKFGKQIKFADKRGIPYVWFPLTGEVKDIRTGEQVAADPGTWMPPAVDLHPEVRPA
ncbi:histidine--tRNA ligase [Nanchangia anserum]|uniref:Histidine--tRNA ligase n=1 Tax=Nanchangia anserum TaxID=2692125 RepID=A0A8I0KTM6_9ACTO|nr:histidine--tRNA ligase [Nanchangia anserum]MBD3688763.1 histidine--tRNA ligase [Nanchangia anserum]QOX82503.1 histidine--tRNA ligase [Nanchangia anserum]